MIGSSLYIHIPFCIKKCDYCDFLSFANANKYHKSYIESLIREMEYTSSIVKDTHINTIFIGGGTPSILSVDLLEQLLSRIPKLFNTTSLTEVTIESNPGTLDREKISLLNDSIVNRISMGVQSSQDRLLSSIGRIHNYESFLNTYHEIRKYPFTINLDLMFGLPSQKLHDFDDTLTEIVKLNPEHISCYGLIIEEGTKFYEDYEKGNLILPDEDVEREMYHNCIKYLTENGYNHYEISNFAKEGFESKHNLVYWRCGSYIGLGAGAHSYYNNERYENTSNLNQYISDCINNKFNKYNVNLINEKAAMEEFMFLGLRLINGISKAEFKKRFNKDVKQVYKEQICKLVSLKLIIEDATNIKLTKTGLDVANTVFSHFLIEEA